MTLKLKQMTSGKLIKHACGVVVLSCLSAHSAFAVESPQTAASEWAMVGGNNSNQRYSPLSQINTKNIDKLGGAWVHELDSKSRTTPTIVDGVLYTNDAVKIYALNAKTGETVWEYQPENTTPARGGVTVANGKAFVGLADSYLIALDQKTGKLLWKGYMGNVPKEQYDKDSEMQFIPDLPIFDPKIGFLASAPNYVNGKVIIGLSGGDAGTRSKIAAFDADTGEMLWDWWAMPKAGEPGSETWPKDTSQMGGGAVWTHGAVDPELGLIYFGTGNAWTARGGELRPGDNLYMASLVALDVNTGKLKWHFQLTHHDIWEMDVSTPPIMYEAKFNGKSRKAVAVIRPDGNMFVFDRATGEALVPIEERPVKQDLRLKTAATQPYSKGADQVGPNCAPEEHIPFGFKSGCYFDPIYYDRPDVMIPFTNVRHAPMSYSPQTGYIYVPGGSSPWWFRRYESPDHGINPHQPGTKEQGIVAAIDARTLKIVWQKESPWYLGGAAGVMTTAGGLLFRLEGDGNFMAFDAKSGEQIWSFQTGYVAGPNVLSLTSGAPSASYEIDGEQYVTTTMGNALWAFKLNGSLAPRPAQPTPPTEYGFQGLVKALGSKDEIGIAALQSRQIPGAVWPDYYVDEYSFSPNRARVRRGTPVNFTNYGVVTYTIVAADGSWTTGPVAPGKSVSVTISKPGKYTYYASEFPWSKGQLVIQ